MTSNAYVLTSDNMNPQTGPASAADIIRAAATPAGPALTIQNPLGLPASNRFIFNRLQIPNPQVNDPVHDTNVVRLTNSGSSALVVNSLALSDTTNWQLVNPPAAGTSIAPGQSLDVTVKFIAQAVPPHNDNQTNDVAPTQDPGITVQQAGGVWNATLTVSTNDPAGPQNAQLAGYWQRMSEHEEEASLQTMINLLAGYTTQIAAQPNTPDLTEGATPQYYGEEVVSGLWQRADTSQPVTVQQFATFHTQVDPQGNLTKLNLGWFPQGSTAASAHTVLSDPTREGQMFFPTATNGTTPGKATFSPAGAFGFNVDGESSVDSQNTVDIQQFNRSGHSVRFFPLRDSNGNLVANSYIMAMDYENSQFDNNDFQDAVFIIQNVAPAGQQSAPATPTNFTAAVQGNNVALTWSAVSGSSIGYNVYRSTSATGSFTKLNSTPIQGTSFTDTAPPSGTTYFYHLTAVNTSSQTESVAAAASAAGVGTTPPPGGGATTDITIGTAAARSLKFTDADGTVATITLKGGTAVVHFTGSNVTQQTLKNHTIALSGTNLAVAGITATGTTASSTLTINAKGGDRVLNVGGITADGGLRSINARTTDLTGTISLGGAAGTINVAALGASAGDTTVTASSVGRISVAHDAVFDLTTATARSIAVKGNLHDSTIRLTGTGVDLKSLSAGTLVNTTVRSDGSIGTISTGQMTGDRIYAGIGTLTGGQTLPSSASDFTAADSISNVRVKKGKSAATFSNTVIAASAIGNAALGSVALSNGGNPFGLASRGIRSVTGSDATSGKSFRLTKLTAPVDTAAALTQQGITAQDFVVRLI